MEYRLLGPLEVLDGDRLVEVTGGKRRALLALLLLNANKVVPAERLIDELWGESPPPTAGKSVQVHVSQLRKALAAGGDREGNGQAVLTRGAGYLLHVEPDALDLQVFERALDDAQQSLAAGDPRTAERRLREALGLWRGPALADFLYEPFAQQEIARLEDRRLAALETRMEAGLQLGEHDMLAGELEALVNEHPLRERLWGQLMVALYRCGRQAEALAAYRRAEKMFRDELGIEPTPELRRLEQRILAQDPELAPPPPPPRAPRAPAPAAVEGPPPRRRPLALRGPLLLLLAAVLVGGAVAAALVQRLRDDDGSGVALDLATNSLVAVDVQGQEPEFAVPLPGRPTGLAAHRGRVWIPTVDSAALTGVEERRRGITRTVPMTGAPDAVAVGPDSIWVADGGRGMLSRIRPGYQTVTRAVRYPPARRLSTAAGRLRVPRTSVAIGAGAVWLTNGSRNLMRVDPSSGRLTNIRAGRPVDAVTVGAGAVWAISSSTATVLRIDPRRRRVTERIHIVARAGGDAPFPIGIAAGRDAVWVLNGNTATVTMIDPSTRGVVTRYELGVERVPNDIAAAGRTAWVANSDGTLARVDVGATAATSIWVGESLDEVATDGARVWATTSAFDQRFPGGSQ